MRDFARSDDPLVQAQLDRLAALGLPAAGSQRRYGLETIRALLARLGDPQDRLPPAFHVAGTNGKGSTCAYLRAMMEAAGLRVHAATKPHLVRYNERIRLAGRLIEDAMLATLLCEALDAAAGLNPSFFEVTTAATFLAFARVPADACIIEVGLGGRLDATNVLKAPAVCGIATLGIDHEAFLLAPEAGTPAEPLARIAFEKAAIARCGSPLVCQSYPAAATDEVRAAAARAGATLAMRGVHWWAEANAQTIAYRDARGELTLPLPSLPGRHQAENAALAVAMLRHQQQIAVSPAAIAVSPAAIAVSPATIAAGIGATRWPARLQLLGPGPLTASGQEVAQVWLDGGHNPDAARAIAAYFANRNSRDKPFVILGMLTNKNAKAFIEIVAPIAGSLIGVPIPGHDHHPPAELAQMAREAGIHAFGTAPDIASALAINNRRGRPSDGRTPVLIAGSLYLAGEVLRLNGEPPD